MMSAPLHCRKESILIEKGASYPLPISEYKRSDFINSGYDFYI